MPLSPSVKIQEIIKERYVNGSSVENAVFVGHFERGPVGIPTYVTTITALKDTFGDGVGDTYNDWYQVFNYLSYAGGLWVVRETGVNTLNASNNTLGLVINNGEGWVNQYPSIPVTPTTPISIFAKTPGTWGNSISVAIITSVEFQNNVELGFGIFAKDVFAFLEPEYFGVVVFRNGVVVELFYKPASALADLNRESTYVYLKYDNSNLPNPVQNLIDFRAQSGVLDMGNLANTLTVANLQPNISTPNVVVDLGPLTSPYNFTPFIFYGPTLLKLANGVNDVPLFTNLTDGYSLFEDVDTYDVDIVIGNERANVAAINLAEVRRDCLAFIGLPTVMVQSSVVPAPTGATITTYNGVKLPPTFNKKLKRITQTELNSITAYLNTLPFSEFAHITIDVKTQLDSFTGQVRVVNIAGDTAGLKAKSSKIAPWTVGAGSQRGNLMNLNSTLLNFNQVQLEDLFKMGVNYITQNTLQTQKTFTTKPSSFDRVNVRSLFNHVEKDLRKITKNNVFSQNDANTRATIDSYFRTYLNSVIGNRGIQDYQISVYTDPVKPNVMLVDVFIKPTFVTEKILMRFNNVGTSTIVVN